jgi:hypothetical protein
MENFLANIRGKYRHFWTSENIHSLILSGGLFILAAITQRIADTYVGRIKAVTAGDLVLNHLPTLDIDGLIVLGALGFTFLTILIVLYKPKYINFALKSLSIFIIIRAFLISLTHLGAIPHQLTFDTNNFGYGLYNILFNTTNDYFFSGHTGIPFLMALVFWPEKKWRYFFFFISFLSGISVLIARLHYSVDVFAAPFMTYSIFAIARHLFYNDYKFSRN